MQPPPPPPERFSHEPAPPSFTEQRPLQQSEFWLQMSLYAWQVNAGAQKPP